MTPTPTHAPGIISAPTWNGRGTTVITNPVTITGPVTIEGDRVLVDRGDIRELLIEADDMLTALASDLDRRMPEGWDPDAYFTPLENTLHCIAEAAGYDYPEDIAAEAYRRRKCERCPESMVLFDTNPARSVPDPNSETCKACEHREARQ